MVFHFVTLSSVHLNTYVGDSEGQVGHLSFFLRKTKHQNTNMVVSTSCDVCVSPGSRSLNV